MSTWIDFWVICDSDHAHLFFTSLDGRLWRSQTSLTNFPRDSRKAAEVTGIESQNHRHLRDHHLGNQVGVVLIDIFAKKSG